MIQRKVFDAFTWLARKAGYQALTAWALLLVVMGSLASGLERSIQGIEFLTLLWIALLAMSGGWITARAKLTPAASSGIGIASGLGYIYLFQGGLLEPIVNFLNRFTSLWINARAPWRVDWAAVGLALTRLAADSASVIEHSVSWLAASIAAGGTFDPQGITLVWGFAVWMLAFFAAWVVRRWRKPILALTPSGVLLAAVVNYSRENVLSLLPFLGASLALAALLHFTQRQQHWELEAIDYAEELGFDYALVTIFLLMGLLSISLVMPSINVQQIAQFGRRIAPGQGDKAEPLAKSLGLEAGQGTAPEFGTGTTPSLPRIHLLGSGPELTNEVVMAIQTADLPPIPDGKPLPAPPARYYWAERVFDVYTGAGWLTSGTETQSFRAGDVLATEQAFTTDRPLAALRLVEASVQVSPATLGNIYLAGELVSVDVPFEIIWRRTPQDKGGPHTGSDLFAATTSANRYKVTTLVSDYSPSTLQAASSFARPQEYPQWVQKRYLQLPPDLPQRVLDLAGELSDGQPSTYAVAKAIETYLRGFPYTLNLSAPPPGRDVADYFLFELRRGYCDYYATAMVVLARAAGLPARMVTGYASGIYDQEQTRYLVRAIDAHSWPEVFLPGAGWVVFEPTAGQPYLERTDTPRITGDLPWLQIEAGKSGEPTEAWLTRSSPWPWLIALATAGTWLLYLALRVVQRMQPARETVTRLWQRMVRRGIQLRTPWDASTTPHEFAAALEQRLDVFQDVTFLHITLNPIRQAVNRLTEIYARSIYSPQPAQPAEAAKARNIWKTLRWRLILAQGVQWLQRKR